MEIYCVNTHLCHIKNISVGGYELRLELADGHIFRRSYSRVNYVRSYFDRIAIGAKPVTYQFKIMLAYLNEKIIYE